MDSHHDRSELLSSVARIAQGAGELIMDYYGSEYRVIEKADKTPLTEADIAAHHYIIERLQELTPDLPILTEESEGIDSFERNSWQRYWLCDPLDGTREFIKRSGEFSVNIAMIEGHRATMGVVFAPVLDALYFASQGHGAFKQEGDGEPQPIRVSTYEGGVVTVAASRNEGGPMLQRFLRNIGNYMVAPMGSALKACLVAEGRADIYPRLGPTMEWDTAAAQCIVEEAGGGITDTLMRPLRYNTREALNNPHFFAFGKTREKWSKYM